MIRAIIIDDEDKARQNLTSLLEEYCKDVNVVADAGTVKEGMAAIKEHGPELVFLDVKMQKETGFDLIEQMDSIDFEVIFVTAHDEFAIKAFRLSATDYIMKPINIDDLVAAVGKVKENLESEQSREGYEILKQNLTNQNKRIAIPTMEGILFVPVSEIIRCEADGSYTHVFLEDGKQITVSKILKEFDELLTEFGFHRVHQSHLVNLEHMKKYISAKGGSVEMLDGSIVAVSRNHKEGFLARLARI